jgi:hypothetical protein
MSHIVLAPAWLYDNSTAIQWEKGCIGFRNKFNRKMQKNICAPYISSYIDERIEYIKYITETNYKQKSQYLDNRKQQTSFERVMSKSRKAFDNFNWDEITKQSKQEILESIYNNTNTLQTNSKFSGSRGYFDSVEIVEDLEYNKFANAYDNIPIDDADDGGEFNDEDLNDNYYE